MPTEWHGGPAWQASARALRNASDDARCNLVRFVFPRCRSSFSIRPPSRSPALTYRPPSSVHILSSDDSSAVVSLESSCCIAAPSSQSKTKSDRAF